MAPGEVVTLQLPTRIRDFTWPTEAQYGIVYVTVGKANEFFEISWYVGNVILCA